METWDQSSKVKPTRPFSGAAVWDMLEAVLFTPPARAGIAYGTETDTPGLSEFSPMTLISDDLDSDAWFFNWKDVNAPDIVWPIDFSAIVDKRNVGPDDGWFDQIAFACNVKSVHPREIRGKTSRIYKHVVRRNAAVILRGAYVSASSYFGWCNGRWVDCFPDAKIYEYVKGKEVLHLRSNYFSSECDKVIKMTQSIALRARYSWAVSFSIYGGPSVRLETDPVGIRHLFKDREPPAGKDKKAALRNWVRDHWRKVRPCDDDTETYVRKHMRGRTEFKWGGFDCVVEPSQFDLEKNMKIAAMKTAGASVADLIKAAAI